jgi:asparagine synthase (glutamine-hydrolysing)
VVWFGASGAATWATPEAREMVTDTLREHAEQHRTPVVPGEFGIGDTAAWLSLNAFARGQRVYDQMAAACGVNHHAPYLDDGVVRACWSVPAWVRTTPEQAKPLLAHAVRDLVPHRLVGRRTKGDYTELAYQGLRRHADALTDLFTRSRLAELGLVDEARVVAELRRGVAGLPIRLGAFDAVLATELWLRAPDATAITDDLRRQDAHPRDA